MARHYNRTFKVDKARPIQKCKNKACVRRGSYVDGLCYTCSKCEDNASDYRSGLKVISFILDYNKYVPPNVESGPFYTDDSQFHPTVLDFDYEGLQNVRRLKIAARGSKGLRE